jgi:hypothetical protein
MLGSNVGNKSLLGDILKGRSLLRGSSGKAYLKHLSIMEQIDLDEFEDESFEEAIASGVKSEGELLKRAEELGIWSKKKEDNIKANQIIIEKTEKNIKESVQLKFISILEKTLESVQKEQKILKEQRDKITSYSAESLASNQRIRKMLEKSLFEDKLCTKKISASKMSDFSYEAISKWVSFYNQEDLARAAYEDTFFEAFVYQNRNPLQLFDGDFKNMTVFQSKLLTYAGVIFNKIKNSSNMPKEAYDDPIKIIKHDDKAAEEKKEKAGSAVPMDHFTKGTKDGDEINFIEKTR